MKASFFLFDIYAIIWVLTMTCEFVFIIVKIYEIRCNYYRRSD
jgi:hypothetical protein